MDVFTAISPDASTVGSELFGIWRDDVNTPETAVRSVLMTLFVNVPRAEKNEAVEVALVKVRFVPSDRASPVRTISVPSAERLVSSEMSMPERVVPVCAWLSSATAVVIDVAPEPVTSPERVMVWLPVR